MRRGCSKWFPSCCAKRWCSVITSFRLQAEPISHCDCMMAPVAVAGDSHGDLLCARLSKWWDRSEKEGGELRGGAGCVLGGGKWLEDLTGDFVPPPSQLGASRKARL